ncbi:MAG: ABC-2 family transporter protein, partial [Thermomicrobiales bacterium]
RILSERSLILAPLSIKLTLTLNQLYGTLTMFLAGQIAPLSLFPEPVRVVASILPFRWMVAFPVEVLLGRVNGDDLLIGIGMQALWIALALLGMRWLWSRGVRRYSAVGA